jgi:hypothetical protein
MSRRSSNRLRQKKRNRRRRQKREEFIRREALEVTMHFLNLPEWERNALRGGVRQLNSNWQKIEAHWEKHQT